MEEQGIPLPPFCEILTRDDCEVAGRKFGYPFVLKNALLAYDGRGNAVVHSPEDIDDCFQRLGGDALYAEKFVPFVKELAVMVVRCCGPVDECSERSGEDTIMCYPVVETIQKNSICDVVICPAQVPQSVLEDAEGVARKAVACLRGRGVFGVELFMLADGQILYNEIAPR